MTERMMRANLRLHPGRVQGHGAECGACKPDQCKGRAEEKRQWRKTEAHDD